jgi:hypothetical protein
MIFTTEDVMESVPGAIATGSRLPTKRIAGAYLVATAPSTDIIPER